MVGVCFDVEALLLVSVEIGDWQGWLTGVRLAASPRRCSGRLASLWHPWAAVDTGRNVPSRPQHLNPAALGAPTTEHRTPYSYLQRAERVLSS